MFFGRLKRCARQVAYYFSDADFNDFHSVLGFSLSPVRCVTDDFQGFSLRIFVRVHACFCLRIPKTTKYSEDLVSAIAAVIARAAMLVAIGIVFI
jgi:hypothetical protein